ncbi:MAG: hypothetical protein MN733_11355 [Nitrososphaera sp.]|nr:hypothetical protein [Nitrososphaera sp.]
MEPADALASLPSLLREALLSEYNSLTNNFREHRWLPSELSGGKFCEIVFTILQGYATKNYPSSPQKPNDFVSACRKLETYKGMPRSFQILIPRLLPALYEIRNNRGVGHVGGDIDPNQIDATLIISICSWIMAELVRVYHDLPISDAQAVANRLIEYPSPIIWQCDQIKRILKNGLNLADQVLVLVASEGGRPVTGKQLLRWTEYENKPYFLRVLNRLHTERCIEFDKSKDQVRLLPPGAQIASRIIAAA